MPRYDYRCPECNEVFEVTHGMRERPEVVCPTCGAAAQRVFDASGIVLKGSGFYNTDMRGGKKGATEGTSGSSEASAKKGGAAEGASDTKAPSASSGDSGSSGASAASASASATASATTSDK